MSETVLQVIELSKIFTARRGALGLQKVENAAVDRVSFEIAIRETFGLVGESGSGKSTLGLTILRLYDADGGQILFDGVDITKSTERLLKPIRKQIQMIFQDPLGSLDPHLTIEQIISEPLEIHQIGSKADRPRIAAELVEKVGLSRKDLSRFPTQFSGGQQQRIAIARTLALQPKVIICDEAVSSLDVSVKAQILNLLKDLQDEYGLSYLFISHNIAVTAFMSNRIGVMYLGRLVEVGTSSQVTSDPRHPYTRDLLSAIPDPDPEQQKFATVDSKYDPGAIDHKKRGGCVFFGRCRNARDLCLTEEPNLRELQEDQYVACHFPA